MDGLASKEYRRQFAKAPEFVVLFLPGEPFFGAAAQHDPALIEDGMKNDVIIATPTTLVALLRAVARGWRQVSLEENARKISEVGRELYDRAGVVFKHLDEVGGALERAMDSYSKAVGSINSRLLPAARRLKELGATSAADLSAPEPAEGAARTLELPEREKKDA
jgi:DNA recombination protein RmuC